MASNSELVLAIDLGTSGPKLGLFDEQCRSLARTFRPVQLRLLPGGGAEQDPGQWWSALREACHELLAQGHDPSRIVALSVTGQWSGTVAVDGAHEPLGPALIWMDSRGAPYTRRVAGGLVRVAGYGVTRALRWVHLTGGAPALTGRDSLSHILYLRHAQPEVYRRAAKFLEPINYLNLRLTGEARASVDAMAVHWVTDNRRIDAVGYHSQLLNWTGLRREQLPELCSAIDVIGRVLPGPASELGLKPGIPVIAGTPDLHSAAIGSGAVGVGQPHLYIGTSSWICAHTRRKQTDLRSNMASLPAALPGRYLLMNEQQTSGACLTYLRDQVFGADDGLTTPATESWFSEFDRLAAGIAPGADGLLFLPWLNGEHAPVDDQFLRGGFYNLSLRSSRAHMIRAVLEGVAFNARWLRDHVARVLGRGRIASLRMVGGGARSDVWAQIYADILDCEIQRIREPEAANLRGAAVLAWAGVRGEPVESVAAQIDVESRFVPRARYRALYDDQFEEFLAYHRRNAEALKLANARRSMPE